jgi:hypothetical protein
MFEMGGQVVGSSLRYFIGKAVASAACFVAGTPIATKRGMVPIDKIEVGDYVWSRDQKTGEEGWRPVVRTIVTKDKPVLMLHLRHHDRDMVLGVTAEHPFWTPIGWVQVVGLRDGDQVWSQSGWASVVSVVDPGHRETVYNLEVGEFHTYFVGVDRVWVHNDCVDVARAVSLRLRSAGIWGECFQHADDLIAKLSSSGIHGTKIVIDVEDKFVYSDAHGALGVQGAQHVAVRIGDVVFDNLSPGGIGYAAWVNDLGGPQFLRAPFANVTETSF